MVSTSTPRAPFWTDELVWVNISGRWECGFRFLVTTPFFQDWVVANSECERFFNNMDKSGEVFFNR